MNDKGRLTESESGGITPRAMSEARLEELEAYAAYCSREWKPQATYKYLQMIRELIAEIRWLREKLQVKSLSIKTMAVTNVGLMAERDKARGMVDGLMQVNPLRYVCDHPDWGEMYECDWCHWRSYMADTDRHDDDCVHLRAEQARDWGG